MNFKFKSALTALLPFFVLACPVGLRASENDPSSPDLSALELSLPGDRRGQPPIPSTVLGALQMEEAVRLAEERNPVIQEKYQLFVASGNQLGAAYATWWPTLKADVNFGWYGEQAYYNYVGALSGISTNSIFSGESSLFGSGSSVSSLSQAGSSCSGPQYLGCKAFTSSYWQGVSTIDLDWTIYDPARQPRIDKDQSLVDEASSDYVISKRDYQLRTREAFVKLQKSLAGVETSAQLVENDQLLLGLARARQRLGVASELDIAKQLTVLKADQVNQVTAQRSARVSQSELAQLLNDPLASSIRPASSLAPIGGWSMSLQDTILAALAYRKVIEKQFAIVRQNESQARIDLAVYLPTISLVNSLYWTKGVGYTGLGPPWIIESARSDLWNAQSLLKVTFTGFDGGQARMEAAASKARALSAKSAVEDAVNTVVAEVREYHSQVEEGRMAVIVASERVDAASTALRLQAMRFTAGYGTITDVVQSQQDLTQSVDAYIEQLADYNLALVNLSRASGVDYSLDEALSARVGNPLQRVRVGEILGLPQ